ncbi:MAG: hypothetical protein FWE32_02395 [Oscillospiraceae bacterium]|nr:hypothetical protein [Oscillospiraceae bacterium]
MLAQNKKRRKIIFGAGEMGRRAYIFFTKDDPEAVAYFADHFKFGIIFMGKEVLSFDEMLLIHHDYDIVLAIFDLFDAIASFHNAGIKSYTVWDDDDINTGWSRFPNAYIQAKKMDIELALDNQNKKILYGAGGFGATVFRFFGNENVYAFADSKMGETRYFGKHVFHPEDLVDLQDKYDILICVADHITVEKKLRSMGITNLITCNYALLDNIAINLALTIDGYGKGFSDKSINEIKDIDFIKYPELIKDYKSIPIHIYRNFHRSRTQGDIVYRSLQENYYYGFCNEMLLYAGCDNEAYECPSISHGILNDDGTVRTIAVHLQSLMQAGFGMKSIIFNQYPSCLYFTVGHFLQYVRSFYKQDTFEEYKNCVGKNLVCFPVHSVPDAMVKYNERAFVDFAFNEAKSFDSITLSAHYNDIIMNKDIIKMFEAGGAHIACSGFISDPSFSRRLKTILSTADAILTNGYGSHIYYAAGLGKPIKHYKQNINLAYRNGVKIAKGDRYDAQLNCLSTVKYELTNEQINILDCAGGLTISRSKEEMAGIFSLSKRIAKTANYSYSQYTNAVHQTYLELRECMTDEDKLMFTLMKEALRDNYAEHIKA